MQKYRLDETASERSNAIEGLTISQVARMTGVKAKAIRYYESIGLLPSPARGSNHYRRYVQADINRLILLRRMRYLGVSLAEARSLLQGVSDARCIDVQQELLHLVHARVAKLGQEIAELYLLRDEVERYQQELAQCQPDERVSFRECAEMSCIAIPEWSTREGVNQDACY